MLTTLIAMEVSACYIVCVEHIYKYVYTLHVSVAPVMQ